jgi:aspartyl-tRNA(Asn)/glutamyl-tRNA(Gln) amidotransferase subunit A
VDAFFLDEADAAVRDVVERAYGRLQAEGAAMPRLELPGSFAQSLMMHRLIMAVDAAESHFATFTKNQDAYGPQISLLLQEGMSTFAIDYALALRHQPCFRQDMARVLQGGRVAVMPATVTAAPFGLDSTGDPRFNSPWSYAGLPAVTIPCGLTDEGMPCGLQLIAGPNEDSRLLATAAWCERVLAFTARPEGAV